MTATSRGVRLLIGAGLAAWALTIGAGLAILWAHADAPGPPATADATWPAAASVERDTRTRVLLLFLHPQCPCSRATLGELARLLAGAQTPVANLDLVLARWDAARGPQPESSEVLAC